MIYIILTDELVKNIVKSNQKCTYLNDKYVILYKCMEAEDTYLDVYLQRIEEARESGIHIPKVIEYRLLNKQIDKRSIGIFVEERAKGNVLNIRGKVLNQNEEYDLEKVIEEYLEKVSLYLNELKKRANAPQKMYNKFLDDFINIHRFGLKPDPNSLNYLFDEEYGFTIIDPYLNHLKEFNEKDLFKFIINDVYGVSRPSILIKGTTIKAFYYLPQNLKAKMDKYSTMINQKLYHAFKQKGYSDKYILSELEKNKMRFYTEKSSFEKQDLIEKLKEQFINHKRIIKLKF